MIVRLDNDGTMRSPLTSGRIAAVRALLARFGILHDRIDVVFRGTPEEYAYMRDTITLMEIVPRAERARRRAAHPNTRC